MDLMSTAQLLGNLGEFVGAIAVVLTLLYVGLQLRQNTSAIKSATMQSVFEATNDVWKNNCLGDLARTEQFVALSNQSDLSEAEDLFYRSWAIQTFRAQENIYYQRKLGIADPSFVSLDKRVRGSMSLNYIRRAWDDGLVQDFLSDEYLKFVESTIGQPSAR